MSAEDQEIGFYELYASDPEKADKIFWDRESHPNNRRGFIKKAGLAAMSMVLGADIVFAQKMPSGLIPAGILDSNDPILPVGKHKGLTVLNDKPWNIETPAHLLDDEITPSNKLFVRNNGIPPQNIDPQNWTLTIEGESVKQKKTYTLQELKSKFKHYTYQLTLECGGNGRYEYDPPAKGNQWTLGAVGSPEWTGVRLKDVLNDVGIKEDAVFVAYYGKDQHLSKKPGKESISRGASISKAMEDESLIAWAMNGQDIPLMNGHPLRLIFGGWVGSASGKWLEKIVVRNKIHDGMKMVTSYKVPKNPVQPGTKVDIKDMKMFDSMPVKSLITYPKSGAIISGSKILDIRGHAWAGDLEVIKMEVSIDFGSTWQNCELRKPKNRRAWQHWKTTIKAPSDGYYEVWARATDSQGKMQPMVVPGWNPKGYLNNACHRIAVKFK